MERRMNDLDGIVLDLDEKEYHERPEFSSTQARQMLDTPARYKYRLEHPQEHKDAFDLGTAVHAAVLGVGAPVAQLDFDSFRTKAAQEARDQARAWGQTPILAKDYAPIVAMKEAVLAHPVARSLFEQDGAAEASVFSTDPETKIRSRARFDFLPEFESGRSDRVSAVDLKTTAKSAAPADFAKTAASFGYHIQQAHYLDALEWATGERIDFAFVVVETAAPHLVAVHTLDEHFRDIGREEAARARELLAECRASGIWPGYAEEINTIAPPMWLVYQQLDQEEEISI
jgi:hypothetical protein